MITIYHNPECGTRGTHRQRYAMGEEAVIIEYLKHPPTPER